MPSNTLDASAILVSVVQTALFKNAPQAQMFSKDMEQSKDVTAQAEASVTTHLDCVNASRDITVLAANIKRFSDKKNELDSTIVCAGE